jgi:L-asparagine transporter-like permease
VVLAVGTEVTAVGLYMGYWFPEVPRWAWVVLFSGALIGVNMMSVKAFGAVEYSFSMVKIIAIVAFILVGAYVVFGARRTAWALPTTSTTAASSPTACGAPGWA